MCGGSGRRSADVQKETHTKKYTRFGRRSRSAAVCAWRAVNTISSALKKKKEKGQRRPRSHLTANLEARLAELLEILPVFGIPGVQEGCKSVRALGDAELREATRPLNESAHQSCIIKARLARLEGRRERGGGVGGVGATVGLSPGS